MDNPFERQEIIPWWQQGKIKNARVLLLGLGDVGSHIAMECARLGVGTIHLVDHECVRSEDLNASPLYSSSDVGGLKARATRNRLQNFHAIDSSEIITSDMDILRGWPQVMEWIQASDVVFNGLPPPEIQRLTIASACKYYKKLMVYAGVDSISGNSGTILVQLPGSFPCYECFQAVLASSNPKMWAYFAPASIVNRTKIDLTGFLDGNEARNSSNCVSEPIAAAIASLGCSVFIQYIHGMVENLPHRIILDLGCFNIESFRLNPRPDCPICRE